jgi:hypothetical protein
MKNKHQTHAQAIGRKGERWFQNALPKHWVFDKPVDDFGFDGRVFIADEAELTALEFNVQVKASARWKQGSGVIPIRVSTASLVMWLSRPTPAMLVLYDESLDAGFFAWVNDLVERDHLPNLKSQRTVTLQVPVANAITEKTWITIRHTVEAQITKFVDQLGTINVTAAVLPTLHTLLNAFRFLYMAEHHWKAVSADQMRLLALGQILAHRDVVAAVLKMIDAYYWQSPTVETLHGFAEQYRRHLSTQISDFDMVLKNVDKDVAIAYNARELERKRPIMMNMLLEMCIGISSIASTTSGGSLTSLVEGFGEAE